MKEAEDNSSPDRDHSWTALEYDIRGNNRNRYCPIDLILVGTQGSLLSERNLDHQAAVNGRDLIIIYIIYLLCPTMNFDIANYLVKGLTSNL